MAKTQQQLQEDLGNFKNYFSQLGSVIIGIVGTASGAAISGAAGPLGLVITFAQVMISGITSAEMAKKMKDVQIAWQEDKLTSMFEYNQLQEKLAEEEIRNKAKDYEEEQTANVFKAEMIHLLITFTLVVIVMATFFILFPRKPK